MGMTDPKSKQTSSDLTIEDIMDMQGDLETLDTQALDKLIEELIHLKKIASTHEEEITRLQAEQMTDPLTNVNTKRVLEQEIGRAIASARRYGRRSAVMIIDMDDFKSINTHFGRDVGDKVLTHVAGLLKQNIRPTDIVARTDGDEFAVLLNEIKTLEDTEMRTSDLLAMVTDTPCILKGRSVCVPARMGFCFFGVEKDVGEILSAAQADLKRRGSPS